MGEKGMVDRKVCVGRWAGKREGGPGGEGGRGAVKLELKCLREKRTDIKLMFLEQLSLLKSLRLCA